MRRRAGAVLAIGVLGAAMAACGGLVPAADAPPAPFPECEDDAYAFVGDTTLAAIGLADLWPEEAQRVGDVRVTAGPADPDDFPVPPGAPPLTGRVMCIEFGDGSGMSTVIDDTWQPPGGFDLATAVDGASPSAAVAIIVAAVAVLAVSVLAFRGRPGGGSD